MSVNTSDWAATNWPWIAALAAAGLIACYLDTTQRRIPNLLSLATLIGGLAYAFFHGGLSSVGLHFAHAAIALIVGMAMFAAQMFGGGDAKFYAAVAGWFALSKGLVLLVHVAVTGLAAFLVWFVARRFAGKRIARSGESGDLFPYGWAIALGGLAAFVPYG